MRFSLGRVSLGAVDRGPGCDRRTRPSLGRAARRAPCLQRGRGPEAEGNAGRGERRPTTRVGFVRSLGVALASRTDIGQDRCSGLLCVELGSHAGRPERSTAAADKHAPRYSSTQSVPGPEPLADLNPGCMLCSSRRRRRRPFSINSCEFCAVSIRVQTMSPVEKPEFLLGHHSATGASGP